MLDINDLRAVFTLLGLVSFVALWVWVYARKRQPAFDEAARLPFADAEPSQE